MAGALDEVLAGLAPRTPLAAIQRVWVEAVGTAFAEMSDPVAESEGRVRVACRSSVWAQELELMAPMVVARLNELLGRPLVTGLRCETRRRR